MKNLKILDKYIVKQVVETFLISLVIFTSIIFATDAFITIVKQITNYGIPLQIAAMLVMLKLPSMLILTIPMGILLATIMTVNRMNNAQEITIFKACGIGVDRIAKPIMICATIASLFGFTVNEIIAPAASQQAKTLTIWAIMQKNVPNGKKNFIFKEMKNGNLHRFFHIASVADNRLHNITVLDLSRKNTIQVIYAKKGDTSPEGWVMDNGVVYTIATTGKVLNTAVFTTMNFDNTAEAVQRITEVNENELNYFDLKKHIKKEHASIDEKINTMAKNAAENSKTIDAEKTKKEIKKHLLEFEILMNEKLALPFTAIVFAIIAIPLAITGPRARFNRGLLFSIVILFAFYILRALAISLGQGGMISPVLAAWLPNIVLFSLGYYLYRRKAYHI